MSKLEQTDAIAQTIHSTDIKAKPNQPPRISLSERDDGSYYLTIGEEKPEDFVALRESLGLNQERMLPAILNQICNATANRSGPAEDNIAFVLAFIRSIEPKDELESLLASQMAAVHIASMTQACAMERAGDKASREYAERAANRLMRTFIAQMQALRKHRHGGEQKVTVQHVAVNEGGQAIVGNVNQGGVGHEKK